MSGWKFSLAAFTSSHPVDRLFANMNFTSEPFLEPEPPTPAHHRRRRRFFPSLTDAYRSELVENLAKRVSPNFDFFLFAILSGAITALAFLFNSYSLLILAALLAPIMTPIIGLCLAGAIGSVRFFFLSLAGVFVACLLVFIVGVLAGVASQIWTDVICSPKGQFLTSLLGCVFVLILGVILTSLSLVKSEQKPVLPSAAIAYVIFSTAGGIGFNLGRGNFSVALNGCLTLGIYLMVGTLVGAIIFLVLGFRSKAVSGYGLMLVILVLSSLLIYQQNHFPVIISFQRLTIKSTPVDLGKVIPGNTSSTPRSGRHYHYEYTIALIDPSAISNSNAHRCSRENKHTDHHSHTWAYTSYVVGGCDRANRCTSS